MVRHFDYKGLKTVFSVYLLVAVCFMGFLVLDGLGDEKGIAVSASTIIVDWQGHGNYTTIQDAIDNANINDTIYVWDGLYNEELIINKSIILIGNGTENTIIKGNKNTNVIYVTANWVNISGFTINNSGYENIYWSYAGIMLYHVEFCNISNNNCSNNENGISMISCNSTIISNNTCRYGRNSGIILNPRGYYWDQCYRNTIVNNSCSQNNVSGIYVYRSHNNTIKFNTLKSNLNYGIYTFYNQYNKFENNYCSNNPFGIHASIIDDSKLFNNTCIGGTNGMYLDSMCDYNIILNNTCLFNTFGLYLRLWNNNNTIQRNNCSDNSYGLYSYRSSYNSIENNYAWDNWNYGIGFSESHNNSISNNSCEYNTDGGISFDSSKNNSLINNSCINNNGDGIELFWSYYNKLENNTCNNFYGDHGIYLYYSSNNTIINNSCYRNRHSGINIERSSWNIILENNCSFNLDHGIDSWLSHKNQIVNNTFSNSSDSGIYSVDSNYNLIENNNCSGNRDNGLLCYVSKDNRIINNRFFNNSDQGIELRSSYENIIDKNKCVSNFNGIFITYEYVWQESLNNTIINNTCKNNYQYGIWVYDSFLNLIENNTCDNNLVGIKIGSRTTQCTIINNSCKDNTIGIDLVTNSQYNVIMNNNCSNNGYGINLENCNYNEIINNTCITTATSILLDISFHNLIERNKCISQLSHGISLEYSDNNDIKNNTCNYNSYSGINLISDSEYNAIMNNSCSFNDESGISFYSSGGNTVGNNTLKNNYNGIYNYYSFFNEIKYNIFNSNNGSGLFFLNAGYSNINNNTFQYNNYGFQDSNSYRNKIKDNNISNNAIGMQFSSSYDNKINQNTISKNSEYGFSLNKETSKNLIFHNVIDQNKVQASDSGTNTWDNGNKEGNYWSDYKGLDNGDNNRVMGDGIGDTEIPHLGLDNYPFMTANGWLTPRPPQLLDPGEISYTQNITLEWLAIGSVDEYILEEDDDRFFGSPTIKYQGSELETEITVSKDGTYYYRVKAVKGAFESIWSNKVDIIVDLPPETPTGLIVTAWPHGNSLNLTWVPNKDVDIFRYEIQIKTVGAWNHLTYVYHPFHMYNDTGRVDGIQYSYRIRASDQRFRNSSFCPEVSGIPKDTMAPTTPQLLRIVNTTFDSLVLAWEPSMDDDVMGYNLYRSNMYNPVSWGLPINGDQLIGGTLYDDTGLDEDSMYYYTVTAVDEVPHESKRSIVASGKTVKTSDYPLPPVIVEPLQDLSMPEDSIMYDAFELLDWVSDPNNDTLIFQCIGQNKINVTINQVNGSVTLKPEHNWNGIETLRFTALDGIYNVSDKVTVTITPVNDPPVNAKIINPLNGTEIENDTALDFIARCKDPDLEYGDKLTYNWSSSLTGFLGEGKVLDDVYLELGVHVITLVVSDKDNESIETSITLTIIEKEEPGKPSDSVWNRATLFQIGVVFSIIIIIFCLIVFLLWRRKRKKEKKVRAPKTKKYLPKTKQVLLTGKAKKEKDDLEDLDEFLMMAEE